jgi:hypothetical protein
MQRILQGTQATLSVTFEVDGVATDPSPATAVVTITRADGTVLINAQATTHGTVGKFSYTLSPAQTALLDTLTADWTANLGTLTTTAEVAGGFLFGLDELNAALGTQASNYTTALKVAARTLAEQALEDACGVAFVPRYALETLSGTGSTTLIGPWPKVTAVRSVSIDGTALSAPALATVDVELTGLFYYPTGWTAGYGNVVVGFEHGFPVPPARVGRACLLLAKRWLVDTPVDDRITSMSTEDGTFSFVTAGVRGAPTDLPEVNAVIDQYGGYDVGIA